MSSNPIVIVITQRSRSAQQWGQGVVEGLRHVRREVYAARVSSHHVSFENFLTHHLHAAENVEYDDLVVHALTRQPFAVGRESH